MYRLIGCLTYHPIFFHYISFSLVAGNGGNRIVARIAIVKLLFVPRLNCFYPAHT
jgi:hypothetical protein